MFTRTGCWKANSGAASAIAMRPRIKPRPRTANRFLRKRNSVYLISEMREACSWRNRLQTRLQVTNGCSPDSTAMSGASQADLRIDRGVEDVDYEVRRYIEDRHDEEVTQDIEEPVGERRLEEVLSNAENSIDALHVDIASQGSAHGEARDSQRRVHGVPECVFEHILPLGDALRARSPNVVLPEDFQHARTGHTQDQRELGEPQCKRREDQMRHGRNEVCEIQSEDRVDCVPSRYRRRRCQCRGLTF